MTKQLLSSLTPKVKRELPVLAWSVRWVLSVRVPKNPKCSATLDSHFTLQREGYHTKSGKTFVLYRMQMLRLLSFPKPAVDQLAIELPCLMGFRSGEVASWMAEYIDFRNMNTLVMDSKKHELFTVPLNLHVARHAEQVLNGEAHGHVLRSRSNRNRGDPITPLGVWYIWEKWTRQAGLPNAHDICPRTGRQFLAAYWLHYLKLSLMTLSKIMRHSEPRVTLGYVEKLIFYEDMKADYGQFETAMAKDQDKFQFRMMQQKEVIA